MFIFLWTPETKLLITKADLLFINPLFFNISAVSESPAVSGISTVIYFSDSISIGAIALKRYIKKKQYAKPMIHKTIKRGIVIFFFIIYFLS